MRIYQICRNSRPSTSYLRVRVAGFWPTAVYCCTTGTPWEYGDFPLTIGIYVDYEPINHATIGSKMFLLRVINQHSCMGICEHLCYSTTLGVEHPAIPTTLPFASVPIYWWADQLKYRLSPRTSRAMIFDALWLADPVNVWFDGSSTNEISAVWRLSTHIVNLSYAATKKGSMKQCHIVIWLICDCGPLAARSLFLNPSAGDGHELVQWSI